MAEIHVGCESLEEALIDRFAKILAERDEPWLLRGWTSDITNHVTNSNSNTITKLLSANHTNLSEAYPDAKSSSIVERFQSDLIVILCYRRSNFFSRVPDSAEDAPRHRVRLYR